MYIAYALGGLQPGIANLQLKYEPWVLDILTKITASKSFASIYMSYELKQENTEG